SGVDDALHRRLLGGSNSHCHIRTRNHPVAIAARDSDRHRFDGECGAFHHTASQIHRDPHANANANRVRNCDGRTGATSNGHGVRDGHSNGHGFTNCDYDRDRSAGSESNGHSHDKRRARFRTGDRASDA
ncbi:MAG TPA: hypothetical protein VNM48_16945, partial [Chloroflexota bacterium]|nr:hypothetical protein [Chloroflexota bacterium]